MTLSRRARPFVIPLIVFSATLVVVVAAIVVVLVSRSGSDDASSVSSDSCLVGAWRVTSHREDVTLASFGTVTFEGSGARVRLNADGTGVTDYGNATRFQGMSKGQTIALDITGKLTYAYAAAEGTVSYRAMESAATSTVYFNNQKYGSTPFEGSTEPATYTCRGNTLTQQTSISRTTLTRTEQ